MDMQQYIFELRKVEQKFNPELFKQITGKGRAAENMVLRIVERVRDTGKSADGSGFKPYSTKPMLTGSKNFLTQAKADAFFKKDTSRSVKKNTSTNLFSMNTGWVTVNGHHLKIVIGGYKQFRELNSRPSNKTEKVFEWSSKMWMNFGVKSKTVNEEGIVIIQKGSGREQKKIEGNSEREGKSIIAPNEAELALFRKEVNEQVIKLLTIK